MTTLLEAPVEIATGTEIPQTMSDLGKPPWSHLTKLKVAGTADWVDVEAGLYFYESHQFGTYYSSDGRSHLCNIHKAADLAQRDGIAFKPIYAGEHTGAVRSVNLVYR